MRKYFGTDGVRGIANQELTPELAFQLGRYGSYQLTKGEANQKIVIGRDTRLSGEMLESSLIAGILSMGVDVIQLGVVSTPCVAYLTRHLKAAGGVMISASHNPFPDNGIKFFNHQGFKLSDEEEAQIETYLAETEDHLPRPTGANLGKIIKQADAVEAYLTYLQSTINTDLTGLKIVVDGANGAAYSLAPQLLTRLGAEVITIFNTPNGVNINEECGSTHPEQLQQRVKEEKADIGLAFDGDADRLIAVDEQGEIIDGDQIMYICGAYLKENGRLKNNTVVATVLSNLGFFKAMESLNIDTVTTKVGDRYVTEELRQGGYSLGGEQSGHIIFFDYNTTGDGLLTAVQLLQVIKSKNQSASSLRKGMKLYPQIMINVKVKEKEGWDSNAAIMKSIRQVEEQLGSAGRILVRPSGTEPLIRIMAEGPDKEKVKQYVQHVADVVQQELG
mgnify:CR=1 FL=1